MTSRPRTGSKYTFDAPAALGELHMPDDRRQRRADAVNPDVEDDDPDIAEVRRAHARQDMQPGTEVKVCGHDDDRDLILVEWTDSEGTPRITSVEPGQFNDHFTKGA